MGENPFVNHRHVLPSCTLRRLERRNAAFIGATLAGMDPWRTLGYTRAGISNYLVRDDLGGCRFAIWASDKLAGVVCVRYPWLLGGFLELLALFPARQGCGLGSEIILWLEQQTRLAAKNLWATVSSFNVKARAFYLHHGFIEVAPLADLVTVGHDEILLRKQL
jgi:diamine N-acetyltransferase